MTKRNNNVDIEVDVCVWQFLDAQSGIYFIVIIFINPELLKI
jgi:hypothetical protein